MAKAKAKTKTKAKAKPKAKAAAKAAPKKLTAVKEPMTKSAVLMEIADHTGLSRKQVQSVFNELSDVVERHVKKGSCGSFTLPGLLKIKTVKKPARKAPAKAKKPKATSAAK